LGTGILTIFFYLGCACDPSLTPKSTLEEIQSQLRQEMHGPDKEGYWEASKLWRRKVLGGWLRELH